MTKRPSLADSMKAFKEEVAAPPVVPAPVAPTPTPPVVPAPTAPAPAPPVPPTAPAPPKFRAATREGMKRLLTPVEPDLHKRLKMLAVSQETTLEAITRAALEAYLLQNAGK